MQLASTRHALIVRRLAELQIELRQTRDEFRSLCARDPALPEVVLRGARLSRERTSLEQQLECLRRTMTSAKQVVG